MKLLATILILLAVTAHAQDVEIWIPTPGAGGMQSNYNRLHTLDPTQLLYNLNGVSDKGVLARRKGIGSFGATCAFGLWGATGYFNKEYGHKVICAITSPDTLFRGVGQFVYSDTFATFDTGYITSGEIYPDDTAEHDWTMVNDALIHADGKQIPFIFTTLGGQKQSKTGPDRVIHKPRLVSMGLEAPGQPRVFQYDSSGGHLSGTYVYGFAYDAGGPDTGDGPGVASAPITLDGGYAAVTNFPTTAMLDDSIAQVFILRKKLDGLNQWYLVDSLYRPETNIDSMPEMWLDTFAQQYDTTWWWGHTPNDSSEVTCAHDSCFDDAVLYFSTEWFGSGGRWGTLITEEPYGTVDSVLSWVKFITGTDTISFDSATNIAGCEQLRLVNPWLGSDRTCYWDGTVVTHGIFDSVVVDTASVTPYNRIGGIVPGAPVDIASSDSLDATTLLAYSLYDPILGIESPLGPPTACGWYSDDSTIHDTVEIYDNARRTGPRWVRVYQTTYQDTNVYYGLFEVRAGDIFDSGNTLILNWYDSQVVNGLDTADNPTDDDYPYNYFRYFGIYPQTRPPWIFDCQIRFSDIEYMNGRLWGIGDELYPYRLYYSAVNYPDGAGYSWNLYDYMDVGIEEIVAMEPALGFGSDALYIFQRNAINILAGADPVFNPFPQVIRSGVGPVSKSAIVRHGNTIFFLSAEDDMRIYALEGTELLDISDGIRDYIDTVFTDYTIAIDSCRAYKLGDRVKWVNVKNGKILSFDTRSGLWSIEMYGYDGAYRPYGSFEHDTVRSGGGPPVSVDILYTADSAAPLHREFIGDTLYDHEYDFFPVQWRFPFFTTGDDISQTRMVQMTCDFKSSTYLRMRIYNEDDSVLLTDLVHTDTVNPGYSYLPKRDADDGDIKVALPIHQGKYLSFELYTTGSAEIYKGVTPNEAVNNDFRIRDLRLFLVRMGMSNVQ